MYAADPVARTSHLLLSAFVVTLAGCSPAESRELIFRVDTDAVVPADFASGEGTEVALVDRIEFALVPKDGAEPCSGCVRTFPVSSAQFRNRAISIGIPVDRGGGRLRIRLFRSGRSGVPRPRSTVEAVFVLPKEEERTNLFAFLPMDSVGEPQGTIDEPLTPERDSDAPSRVGTFGEDHDGLGCSDDGPPGTACVPGGFFWADDIAAPAREQLVFIRAAFVDLTEWSAERFASAGGRPTEPEITLGRECPTAADGKLPASCVSPVEAARLCKSVGGRLPTFHEFSRLLGGLRGTRFPWGDEAPSCRDAVVGRMEIAGHDGPCMDLPSGPVPVDAPADRDIVTVPSGKLLHLAGNIGEWVSATNADSCLSQSVIAEDPRCPDYWGLMGGSYDAGPRSSSSIEEVMSLPEGSDASTPFDGFRCVYDVAAR